jgi:hypothetical protein
MLNVFIQYYFVLSSPFFLSILRAKLILRFSGRFASIFQFLRFHFRYVFAPELTNKLYFASSISMRDFKSRFSDSSASNL